MTSQAPPTLTHLLTSLTTSTTRAVPAPHPHFLGLILNPSTRPTNLNLASLTATARHRILASDITQPCILDAGRAPNFPSRVTDRSCAQDTLSQDVFCQVREVEDVGRSKWEQIELLEAERKGEMVKGREIVRVVPATQENGEGPGAATQAAAVSSAVRGGPFLLELQDQAGVRVQAFEMQRIEKVGYPPHMGIGCKIWLKKGAKVARGVVLLEPAMVVVVGGRVEIWDKRWRDGREQRLRDEVNRESEADAPMVASGNGGGR